MSSLPEQNWPVLSGKEGWHTLSPVNYTNTSCLCMSISSCKQKEVDSSVLVLRVCYATSNIAQATVIKDAVGWLQVTWRKHAVVFVLPGWW